MNQKRFIFRKSRKSNLFTWLVIVLVVLAIIGALFEGEDQTPWTFLTNTWQKFKTKWTEKWPTWAQEWEDIYDRNKIQVSPPEGENPEETGQ